MRNQPARPCRPADPELSSEENPPSDETDRDVFDLWLRGCLRAAFDRVASEPVPEDLLRMIEEDRAERERLRRKRHGLPE